VREISVIHQIFCRIELYYEKWFIWHDWLFSYYVNSIMSILWNFKKCSLRDKTNVSTWFLIMQNMISLYVLFSLNRVEVLSFKKCMLID
jgi:hypothetical protein